jgi:hypothetical protein
LSLENHAFRELCTHFFKNVLKLSISSNCSNVLLDFLFEPDQPSATDSQSQQPNWKTLCLRLAQYSFGMREKFGREAIHRVLAADNIDTKQCEFLCYFAQDAWSRVILRESGALSRILDILADPHRPNGGREQAQILRSLKHFVYDTQSMAYLCQRQSFLEVVLNHIRRYLGGNSVKCKVEIGDGQWEEAEEAQEVDFDQQMPVEAEQEVIFGF